MMPNMPPGGGPGSVPMGGGPPGGGGGPSPMEIKQQLLMLLQKAKQLAEENGLNWQELVSSVGGGASKVRPPSVPPSSPMPPVR